MACPWWSASGPGPGSNRVEVLQLLAGLGAAAGGLDEREGLHLAVDFQGEHPRADDRGGHADVAGCAVREPDVDVLKVRLEGTSADSGAFGADAPEILGLTAGADMVAERRLLAAHF